MDSIPIGSALGRAGAAARFLLLGAGLLVLLTACTRPGATTPTANSGPPAGGGMAKALAYSKCMRSHGVSNYPDPTSNGNGGVSMSSGNVDTNSPQFKAAEQACEKYRPGPGNLDPEQLARLKKDDLAMANCMHDHGFPTFPDPDGQGVIVITPSDGLNQGSPQFQHALSVCQKGMTAISSRTGSATKGSGSR